MSKLTTNSIFNVLNGAFSQFMYDDQTYPPSDVCREDNATVVSVALAGYDPSELELKQKGNLITLTGSAAKKGQNGISRLSYRNFVKRWSAPQNAKVQDISFVNGLLTFRVADTDTPEVVYKI